MWYIQLNLLNKIRKINKSRIKNCKQNYWRVLRDPPGRLKLLIHTMVLCKVLVWKVSAIQNRADIQRHPTSRISFLCCIRDSAMKAKLFSNNRSTKLSYQTPLKLNPSSLSYFILSIFNKFMVQRQNSQLLPAEEVARFQRLFPNLSWLTSGRTSSHQNLVSIFPGTDN